MSLASKFRINTEETFQRLTKAPIVEAAIAVRAQAKMTWDEPLITEQLKTKLPDYPNVQSPREFRSEFKVEIEIGKKPKVKSWTWAGRDCALNQPTSYILPSFTGTVFYSAVYNLITVGNNFATKGFACGSFI